MKDRLHRFSHAEFSRDSFTCIVAKSPLHELQVQIKTAPSRLVSVDALRGLAAVLMVQQHLGIWMVNPYSYGTTLRTIFAGINMTGGAAAPLFITLAGVGSALGERGGKPRVTTLRGALLVVYGVLLNLMVPSWFSLWSFYVLHLLGVWLIVAPAILRLRGASIPLLATLVLAGAVLGQSLAETPQTLTNELMRSTARPGGAFRLALLESQFPIFPWLALAIGGVWAGRAVAAGRLTSPILRRRPLRGTCWTSTLPRVCYSWRSKQITVASDMQNRKKLLSDEHGLRVEPFCSVHASPRSLCLS